TTLKASVLFLLAKVLCVGVALSCEGGADCGDQECCMIGQDGSQTCQPFLSTGDVCHMLSGRDPRVKPAFPVKECPCQRDTVCVPDDPDSPAILGAK
ncbi:hypothetical protein BaRGS_00032164, partial [Batillaria attramentaria]